MYATAKKPSPRGAGSKKKRRKKIQTSTVDANNQRDEVEVSDEESLNPEKLRKFIEARVVVTFPQESLTDAHISVTPTGEIKLKGRDSPCWIWTGSKIGGYATMKLAGGKVMLARRASYIAYLNDPPLLDRVVKCTCGNKLCVNPAHLEIGVWQRAGRRRGVDLPATYSPPKGGRHPKYPWDKWLSAAEPFLLTKGKHYSCKTYAMAQQIRTAAYGRDVKVSLSLGDDYIWVTILGGDTEESEELVSLPPVRAAVPSETIRGGNLFSAGREKR